MLNHASNSTLKRVIESLAVSTRLFRLCKYDVQLEQLFFRNGTNLRYAVQLNTFTYCLETGHVICEGIYPV